MPEEKARVRAHANVVLLGRLEWARPTSPSHPPSRACQAGFSICFASVDDLVRQMREAEALGRFAVLSINGPSDRLKDRFLTPPEPPMP